MAVAYARIKLAIETAIDAGSDLLKKVLLGTPGSYVQYPEPTVENQWVTNSRETGGIWEGDLIPTLFTYLGSELDMAACIWAKIETNGVGQAPTFLGQHTNVTSASKDEVANTVTVSLSPAYVDADSYICWGCQVGGSFAIPRIAVQGASSFAVQFTDGAGVPVGINSRTLLIFACGQV